MSRASVPRLDASSFEGNSRLRGRDAREDYFRVEGNEDLAGWQNVQGTEVIESVEARGPVVVWTLNAMTAGSLRHRRLQPHRVRHVVTARAVDEQLQEIHAGDVHRKSLRLAPVRDGFRFPEDLAVALDDED